MRTPLSLCLSAVVTVGLPSQTTHLVGPGALPEIRDTDPNGFVVVFVSPELGHTVAPAILEQPGSISLANFWSAGLLAARARTLLDV